MMAWQSISTHLARTRGGGTRTVLGKARHPQTCRFCKATEATRSFAKDAHVIPAALGNRTLFSAEECDECNELLGSPLEDDLAKFLAVARAILRVRGRNGFPKHRIAGARSFMKGDPVGNGVRIFAPDGEDHFKIKDHGNGHLELEIPVPTFRPVNVAKALARMAIFALPVDDPVYTHWLKWIRGDVEWYPIPILRLFAPGAGIDCVGFSVSRYSEELLSRVVF